ncbi:MAG TPA: glycosyltransferase family 4 protein [Pyrinomonadaceae bacterium]|nr:glycosyltransferase family 4 protein [Pyrinomonadaceae bacterium]
MIRNVLICTTQVPFVSGGAEAHVAGLAAAFRREGYNAETVALPFKWYPPEEIVNNVLAWRLLDLTESNGVPVDLLVGMKFPAYCAAHPRKVLWIIHQHRSAYNLSGTPFDDLLTHPEGPRVRALIQRCDEQFIPEARKVFANSKEVAARLLRYNGIESEPLYHPPPRAERLFSGEAGDYVFYPSRVESQKRQTLLVEAMRYVKTPVRAVLAGRGPALAECRALAKERRVADRVELRGFVGEAELIDLYANALAVCYLPFDEDYGYVALEAMYAGRAVVVASDGGGAAEFVADGENGFVVEPDARALAARLDELYRDRALARRLGARGREKVLGLNLSWSNVVERLVSAAS